jgi:hypothetical protein
MTGTSAAESSPRLTEPYVLGTTPDPESLALCEQQLSGMNYRDLYQIWVDPEVTSPTVRQFIVARLTAPTRDAVPYPADGTIGYLMHIKEDTEVGETNSLRHRLKDRPELAAELATSVLYWLGTTAGQELKAIHPPDDYRMVTRHLLSMVPEDTADRLFDYYQSFGDEALARVVIDREAPDKYVETSLEQLLAASREESTDVIESATRVLIRTIVQLTEKVYFDGDLMLRIVQYLENRIPSDRRYSQSYEVPRVAVNISDEALRFKYMWRHLNAPGGKGAGHFSVYSDQELFVARWTREYALAVGHGEAELQSLDALIAGYEAAQQKKVGKEAARLALLARLRAVE